MQPERKNAGFKIFAIILLAMLLTPVIWFAGASLGGMLAAGLFDSGRAVAKMSGGVGLLGLIVMWRYALKLCGFSWRKGKGFTPD